MPDENPPLQTSELEAWATRILAHNGAGPVAAQAIAAVVAAAERDGARSHGVFRMPGYVSSLRAGWVDGHAVPRLQTTAPGTLAIDAANGFARIALLAGLQPLIDTARTQGVATLAIRHSHHFAALWPDVEPLAEAGLIAIAVVNSRAFVIPEGGHTVVFGTNPMAFACPRQNRPPLVWDQASSAMARGDVQLALRAGRAVPPGVGVDRDGKPTTEPARILQGGAQCAFGGHKGASIALMVELLAAALTGGAFGFEDTSHTVPGAATSAGGQFLLAIDPARITPDAPTAFPARVETLLARIVGNGTARLPGEKRLARRARTRLEGITLPPEDWAMLRALAPDASP